MTSVSLEAWKMAPLASSSARSSVALVMLPLWATAIRPLLQRTEKGWALQLDGVAGGGVAGVADGERAGEFVAGRRG